MVTMRLLFLFCVTLVLSSPCNPQGLSFSSLPARTEPEWMSKATIYEIWLNAFSQEGTLKGALPGLKHVADLGISRIPKTHREALSDAARLPA